MTDYTTTEARICIDFCNAAVKRAAPDGSFMSMEDADAAFTCWLAAHDAEKRAEWEAERQGTEEPEWETATPRGFGYTKIQVSDYEGQPPRPFSVQQSSLATECKVWIGVGDDRAHMSVDEARRVRGVAAYRERGRTMTVSVLFELQATEDEPIREILTEIDAMPHWERQLMTARIMRFRADQMAEEAAGALALQASEDRRQARARETRERNRAAKPGDDDA